MNDDELRDVNARSERYAQAQVNQIRENGGKFAVQYGPDVERPEPIRGGNAGKYNPIPTRGTTRSETMTTTLRDPQAATSLTELCGILNEWAHAIAGDDGPDDYDDDLSSLPTFGGPEVQNTGEVWSWDAESVLVSGAEFAVGHSGWTIEPRCSVCGEATFHCDHD